MRQYESKASTIIFQGIVAVFMLLMSAIVLYPFLNIVAKSFSTGTSIIGHSISIIPVDFTLENYKAIFANQELVNSLWVSVARTVVGAVLHIIVTGLAAYSCSKTYLKGRRVFIIIFLIPMYYSAGLIPTYMLVTWLGLSNNFLVYILPLLFSTFDFLLMLTYFRHIPDTYEEAGRIDGASDVTILTRIYTPLALPVIATIALFIAVFQWNSWFDSLMYVTKPELFPVQLVLQNIIKNAAGESMLQQARYGLSAAARTTITSQSIKMATLCFTVAPIIMVYPFLQRYFVKGVMVGGIKA